MAQRSVSITEGRNIKPLPVVAAVVSRSDHIRPTSYKLRLHSDFRPRPSNSTVGGDACRPLTCWEMGSTFRAVAVSISEGGCQSQSSMRFVRTTRRVGCLVGGSWGASLRVEFRQRRLLRSLRRAQRWQRRVPAPSTAPRPARADCRRGCSRRRRASVARHQARAVPRRAETAASGISARASWSAWN
jgi:hypothetical protein